MQHRMPGYLKLIHPAGQQLAPSNIADIASARTVIDNLQKQLQAKDADIQQKNATINSLTSQVQDLQTRLAAATPDSVQRQLQSLATQLSEARQRLEGVGVTTPGVLVGGILGYFGKVLTDKITKK